jgi:hypothetical protein
MSAGRVVDLDLEELTWAADAAIITRRTERSTGLLRGRRCALCLHGLIACK